MDIGTIKTITLNEGRFECVVDFGADDVDPLVIPFMGSNSCDYPFPGDEVLVDRDGAESTIVAVFRQCPDGMSQGDRIIYGRDADGNQTSSVKVMSDGTVKINDGERSEAAFPELKTGFDTLKQDVNNLINAYNAHIHTTTATIGAGPGLGVIAPTTSAASTSSASIDDCESPTVVIP